jgi:cytoskeletal protein CcmA (bactofilin family)
MLASLARSSATGAERTLPNGSHPKELPMENMAKIGSSIRIKGEVIAREPLTILGQVEGTVDADGHPITVEPGAKVSATISAQTIVVAGHINGSISADARIVLRDTANVEGDLSAPAISVAEGATVHGRIETAPRKSNLSLAS